MEWKKVKFSLDRELRRDVRGMDSTGVEEYLDRLRDYELFEQEPTL